MENNEVATVLARAALQGFFGTDKNDFRDMNQPSRKAAVARVRDELDKLNLIPGPIEGGPQG